MKPEYYPDVKKLIELPEWKTYQKLLEDERQLIISVFENDAKQDLFALRCKVEELKKIMRLPFDLVREHEAREKEKR